MSGMRYGSRCRNRKCSKEQKEVMISFLERNPCMLFGKGITLDERSQINKRWNELKRQLEGCRTGCKDKTVEEWKKTWSDLKRKARILAERIRQRNGNLETELSNYNVRLLTLINELHGNDLPTNGSASSQYRQRVLSEIEDVSDDEVGGEQYITFDSDSSNDPLHLTETLNVPITSIYRVISDSGDIHQESFTTIDSVMDSDGFETEDIAAEDVVTENLAAEDVLTENDVSRSSKEENTSIKRTVPEQPAGTISVKKQARSSLVQLRKEMLVEKRRRNNIEAAKLKNQKVCIDLQERTLASLEQVISASRELRHNLINLASIVAEKLP